MNELIQEYHPSAHRVINVWESVGLPSRGIPLHQAIEAGLPVAFFDRLAKLLDVDKKSLAAYADIAPATLQRRLKAGRFSRDESDRLYSFVAVINAATDLFEGNGEAASQWLKRPVRALNNRCPIEMLATRVEADAVLDVIGRLEHGVFT